MASSPGFRELPARGDRVSGMMPAATRRSKVQWYEPCVELVGGTGAGSLTGGSVCG